MLSGLVSCGCCSRAYKAVGQAAHGDTLSGKQPRMLLAQSAGKLVTHPNDSIVTDDTTGHDGRSTPDGDAAANRHICNTQQNRACT
jgi:hypothetical protein